MAKLTKLTGYAGGLQEVNIFKIKIQTIKI